MSVDFHPDHSLSRVKGVGPAYARQLAARGLRTFEDALYFLPLRYEDRRRLTPIGELAPGQPAVVQGTISRSGPVGPPRRRRFEMEVFDDTGHLSAVWFNYRRGHLDRYEAGTRVVLSGRVEVYQGRTQMVHPYLRPVGEDGPSAEDLALWPVYPQVGSLPPRRLQAILGQVVDSARDRVDPLAEILPPKTYPLPLGRGFHGLHRPPDEADPLALEDRRSPWHRTVIVNEFFYFCLGLALTARSRRAAIRREAGIEEIVVEKFTAGLPFEPTRAQARAMAHVRADLGAARPMSRLLMGDVGSGKTVVAAAAVALAAARGQQAAVMSPTDVLARQLHRALGGLLVGQGIEPALLTGTIPAAEAAAVRDDLVAGRSRVVVGTQALIQASTEFADLGLVVVDEQHRFGVAQRHALLAREPAPDLLVMSATPIPRTLALTLYGDLDLTAIDELPPGRPPVVTRVCALDDQPAWAPVVAAEIEAGGQAFVVAPVIEASEALGVDGAVEFFDQVKNLFPGGAVGLVHGRLDAAEQQAVIADFEAGRIRILVATTVIEVGIDVPGATVMVVCHAERFGLAQLHQLRGRVGRAQDQARAAQCLLLHGSEVGAEALSRLEVMCKTRDGFVVAEEDLKRRGPGEFLGRRQSGVPVFRAAHLVADLGLLEAARAEAGRLLEKDPDLSSHPAIKAELIRRWGRDMHLGRVL